jgi:hypothetical protein
MRPVTLASVVVLALAIVTLGVSPAMAGKPQDVIPRSNGFPSGPHFNMNIHGKAWTTCNATPDEFGNWGNSIFIPEYGSATIEYLSNKNSSVYELTVLDPCAGFNGATDLAKVQLPYKVLVDGVPTAANGYYVFARIHGKPNNASGCDGPAKNCPPSSITLYPNVITQACSDTSGTNTDCLWALGLITQQDIYVAGPEGFLRFDPGTTTGKGKSTARDISRLFTWSGWVFYGGSPDTNGDGIIDETDIPADAATYVADLDGSGGISLYEWKAAHADFNGDGVVSQADLDAAYAEAPAGLTPDAYVPDVNADLLITLYDWQAYHPDSNGDGLINEADILPGAELFVTDLDNDGVISVREWLEYQESIGTAVHYDTPIWIFELADLVVTQQDIVNDGSKLLQVRFYPVATTEYVAPGYIMVDKVTDPRYDTQRFDFALSGGPDSISRTFQLQDDSSPYDGGSLKDGLYTISEAPLSGWSLTGISILDPDGQSTWTPGTSSAAIDLDPGETVVVIYSNTKQQL